MPLEFALRPRIRLRDDFAAAPRRSRWRLPRFALPVLGYWLAIGGISYTLIHAHDSTDSAPVPDEPLAASEPQADRVAAAVPSEPEPTSVVVAPAPPLATAEAEPEPEPEPASPPPLAVVEAHEPASFADPPRPSHAAAPREERTVERAVARAHAQNTVSENEIAPLAAPFAGFEPPVSPALESPRSRDSGRASSSLPSCETAAAAATEDLDFASSDRTADLPSSAIASVLENGVWLSSCGVPASTSLDICVAIKGGRVTAATVVSSPADAGINACVRQRAAALQFPYSTRVDIARTRF